MTDSSFTEGRLPLGADVVKGFLTSSSPAMASVGKSTGVYAKNKGFHVNSKESVGFEGLADESFKVTNLKDAKQMDDQMTKDELNAHLAKNKAEVEAVAAGMKTEMANFRTSYVESFSELSKTLNRIESRADATEKRLTQAQWVISLVISICAVTLSAVIFFSNKGSTRPLSQPSVVVNTTQPSTAQSPSDSTKSH